MIEEEEREKASKEAKAKSKKGKKQRQKEKKKGKDQKGQTNDGEQLSQDQVSAVEDQNADAHRVQGQQQPAGGSAEGGGDAGEPSGIGTVCLGGYEDHAIPASGGDREPRGSGSATATAANQQAAALTALLGYVGSAANSAPNTAAAATVTSTAVSASNALHAASTDTPTAATTAAASTSTSMTILAAAAIAAPTATAASASDALPTTFIDTPTTTTSVAASTPACISVPDTASTSASASVDLPASALTPIASDEQYHPFLNITQSGRAAMPKPGQHQHYVQPQILQPPVVQPQVVQPGLAPPQVVHLRALQPYAPQAPQGQALASASGGVPPGPSPSMPTHLPRPTLQAAPIGAYQPLRQRPPHTTAPHTNLVPPSTKPTPPSITAPLTDPMRPPAFNPAARPAHATQALGLTSAMRPGMNPALIGQVRQAAMGAAHPPPPIPSAVLPPPHTASPQRGGGRAPTGADDDSRLCIVCMERERDVCLHPCRHVSMCSPCCEEVLAKKRECPICRTKVVEHVGLVWS